MHTRISENPEHDTGRIHSVTFTPNDDLLISAGPWGTADDSTGTILLWDVARHTRFGRSLNEHDSGVTNLLVSPDGQSLYSTGPDDYIVVNSLDVAYWERRACQLANRKLTAAERDQYAAGRAESHVCDRVNFANRQRNR